MRPIPHHGNREKKTDERVRPTTRREATEEREDDETWLAVQEF